MINEYFFTAIMIDVERYIIIIKVFNVTIAETTCAKTQLDHNYTPNIYDYYNNMFVLRIRPCELSL